MSTIMIVITEDLSVRISSLAPSPWSIISIMLKIAVRKRRVFLIVLSVIILLFGGALGAVYYFGNKALAEQQVARDRQLEQYDKNIAKAVKDRKDREEAAKKAAEQKKAADDALVAQQAGKVVTPKGCAVSGPHGDPNSVDVVINKKRCFNPIDFTPKDLVSFNGYVISAKIQPHLTEMFSAASAAGVPLSLTSSYRSYANQVATYNNWVRVNGSTAAADTVSARPGYSEHQTGYAVDLAAGGCSLECFSGSAQYRWMSANAATYGFIERYPVGLESVTGYSPESWHWRYVGPSTASSMKTSSIKTLEQLWNLPGGGY